MPPRRALVAPLLVAPLLVALLLLASAVPGCRPEEPETPRRAPAARRESPATISLSTRLARHIDSLAVAGGYRSRVAHTPGNRAARSYIERALAAAGLRPRIEPIGGTYLANIVATIPGASDSVVVVGAHYDASASRDPRWRSAWTSMPAPGAVDNASGVAAMLEIARAVRSRGRPRYTVELVAFDAEELSPRHRGHHLGSHAFAARLRADRRRLRGAIILDMVVSKGSGGRVGLFASARSQALARELDALHALARSSTVLLVSASPCSRSDNQSFDELGLPAVLFMESCAPWRTGPGPRRRYAGYHSSGDRPEQVDLAVLSDVVDLVAAYLRAAEPGAAGRISDPRGR